MEGLKTMSSSEVRAAVQPQALQEPLENGKSRSSGGGTLSGRKISDREMIMEKEEGTQTGGSKSALQSRRRRRAKTKYHRRAKKRERECSEADAIVRDNNNWRRVVRGYSADD